MSANRLELIGHLIFELVRQLVSRLVSVLTSCFFFIEIVIQLSLVNIFYLYDSVYDTVHEIFAVAVHMDSRVLTLVLFYLNNPTEHAFHPGTVQM